MAHLKHLLQGLFAPQLTIAVVRARQSAPLLALLEKALLDDRPETQERAMVAYSQLAP